MARQRYDAFKKTITEDYPEIKIVAEQAIREPDFFYDANKVALSMLAADPKLKGIWAVWDLPAEGVMSAAQIAGRRDLAILKRLEKPGDPSEGASSRKATWFSAPRGSPAASARAAALISESI